MSEITLKTAAEIVAGQNVKVPFVVERLIVPGVTIITGTPKVGKSRFATYLANCIGTSSLVFGELPVQPARVLYLSLEENQNDIQIRLDNISSTGQSVATKKLDFVFQLADSDHLIPLIDESVNQRAVKVIIIDLLASVLPMGSKYKKEYETMHDLKKYADEHQLSIICIHHNSKSVNKNITNRITGSTGLSAGCDNIIMLTKNENSDYIKLDVFGRDIQKWSSWITESDSSLDFRITHEDPDSDSDIDLKLQTLIGLKATQEQMGVILDRTQSTIHRLLKEYRQNSEPTLNPVTPNKPTFFNLKKVNDDGEEVFEVDGEEANDEK